MFKKGMFWRESYLPNPLSYLHPAMLHQALPTDSPYYTNICSANCRQTAVEVLSSLPPCLTSHSGGLWCSQLQHCTDRSTTVLPCLSLQHVWGAQLFNLCPWPQSPRTSSCNSTPTLCHRDPLRKARTRSSKCAAGNKWMLEDVLPCRVILIF